ncbi:hypothetical protein FRC05_001236 [Tulasnella sp. 425]|nr:hypothetical protein FRC05_001236 [Tulasnella sp. 425]
MSLYAVEEMEPPLPSRANILVPVIISLVGIALTLGALCRWMGVRGRRRLDQLEASQWEEGELDELEPNVDYGEKPVIFNIHVKESERSNDNVSSATPLSVWLDTTQGPGHTKHPPDPSARREASYIERLKRRLRREKMDRQHGIESSGTQQGLKSTSVSIAFLIAMPSEEKGTEKADGSVLPELVVGIDDIHVS